MTSPGSWKATTLRPSATLRDSEGQRRAFRARACRARACRAEQGPAAQTLDLLPISIHWTSMVTRFRPHLPSFLSVKVRPGIGPDLPATSAPAPHLWPPTAASLSPLGSGVRAGETPLGNPWGAAGVGAEKRGCEPAGRRPGHHDLSLLPQGRGIEQETWHGEGHRPRASPLPGAPPARPRCAGQGLREGRGLGRGGGGGGAGRALWGGSKKVMGVL